MATNKENKQKKDPIKNAKETLSVYLIAKAVIKEFKALNKYGIFKHKPIIY